MSPGSRQPVFAPRCPTRRILVAGVHRRGLSHDAIRPRPHPADALVPVDELRSRHSARDHLATLNRLDERRTGRRVHQLAVDCGYANKHFRTELPGVDHYDDNLAFGSSIPAPPPTPPNPLSCIGTPPPSTWPPPYAPRSASTATHHRPSALPEAVWRSHVQPTVGQPPHGRLRPPGRGTLTTPPPQHRRDLSRPYLPRRQRQPRHPILHRLPRPTRGTDPALTTLQPNPTPSPNTRRDNTGRDRQVLGYRNRIVCIPQVRGWNSR